MPHDNDPNRRREATKRNVAGKSPQISSLQASLTMMESSGIFSDQFNKSK
jgi:hypothetical protein